MGYTISINALKYATTINNYITTTAAILAAPLDNDPYLTTLFFTNNVASKVWIRKRAKWSLARKALGFLQCAIMINNPVGIKVNQISTTNNIVAD